MASDFTAILILVVSSVGTFLLARWIGNRWRQRRREREQREARARESRQVRRARERRGGR